MDYKSLKKQTFSLSEFSIVPIRMEDRYAIMKWRNEQLYHLRQAQPLTVEDQDRYFAHVVAGLFGQEQPGQILFSFLKAGVCVGYGGLVHINWLDRNAELSFIMDTSLEKEFFHQNWSAFLSLIEEVAFRELGFHKIYTYAFDLRPHLYPVLEDAGFSREAELVDHCFFNGTYKDVIIHSKLNIQRALSASASEISYRKATASDVDLVFSWSNDELVRSQSFNSDPIRYEDHLAWFSKKMSSATDLLVVVSVDRIPAGLLRFEVSDQKTVMGILLDPKFRGKGLAPSFIKGAVSGSDFEITRPIVAYIKKTNAASLRVFEKAGFSLWREDEVGGHSSLVYLLDTETDL